MSARIVSMNMSNLVLLAMETLEILCLSMQVSIAEMHDRPGAAAAAGGGVLRGGSVVVAGGGIDQACADAHLLHVRLNADE
jgi:hypothetical protein